MFTVLLTKESFVTGTGQVLAAGYISALYLGRAQWDGYNDNMENMNCFSNRFKAKENHNSFVEAANCRVFWVHASRILGRSVAFIIVFGLVFVRENVVVIEAYFK
jgi:hypothetical protein